jgi:hypothetical protein
MKPLSLRDFRKALGQSMSKEVVVGRRELTMLLVIAEASLSLTEAESSGIFDVRLGGLVDALKEVKK